MSKQNTAPSQGDDVAERIERIKEVRAQAIEHTRRLGGLLWSAVTSCRTHRRRVVPVGYRPRTRRDTSGHPEDALVLDGPSGRLAALHRNVRTSAMGVRSCSVRDPLRTSVDRGGPIPNLAGGPAKRPQFLDPRG